MFGQTSFGRNFYPGVTLVFFFGEQQIIASVTSGITLALNAQRAFFLGQQIIASVTTGVTLALNPNVFLRGYNWAWLTAWFTTWLTMVDGMIDGMVDGIVNAIVDDMVDGMLN